MKELAESKTKLELEIEKLTLENQKLKLGWDILVENCKKKYELPFRACWAKVSTTIEDKSLIITFALEDSESDRGLKKELADVLKLNLHTVTSHEVVLSRYKEEYDTLHKHYQELISE